jgi:diguanylate cyclase (GGDEF)-like protein/PAS domain S-box-containing protein
VTDDRYRALFEQNPEPLLVWEKPSGRILAANAGACDVYGYTIDTLLSMTVFQLRRQEPEYQRLPLPEDGSIIDRTQRRFDGSVRESEMHTKAVQWDGRPAFLTLLVDVTQRNADERQLRRINRLYSAASQINRVIFGLPNRKSILQAACDIAVDAGDFRLAWIGLLDSKTGYLDVAAQAGTALAYIDNIRVTIHDIPEGRGPMGTAMRECRLVVENDFLNSAAGEPWRDDAARHELRAIICAPILQGIAVVGALGLYGPEAGMFQEQEQRLITELTSDIGLALHDLERRIRLQFEERMRSTAQDVYELIASDAPTERVAERLHVMLAQHSRSGNVPTHRVMLPLIGETMVTDEQLPFLGSIEQLATIALERTAARERLEHQALHDALTDLPNRLLFADRLTQALAIARRHGRRVAVGLLDLDRFKVVNDTLGHAKGDALLRAVAARLKSGLHDDETIARMGGDEFLIIFPDLDYASEADDAARRLLALLDEPFTMHERELYVRASLGLVISDPATESDAGMLLQRADQAMYQAKRSGSGYALAPSDAQRPGGVSDLDVESDLYRALQQNELIIHYQPFVNAENDDVPAVEALVRWQHPVLGLLAPERFIPLAESSGLIISIGEWVLNTACAQAAQWARDGHDQAVTVNISARQFAQQGLQATIVQALARSGLRADRLWLEITETAVMQSVEATAQVLIDLKAIGVRILIDDFGTGYASLSYLHRLPIDMLKIDRSFVSGADGPAQRAGSGMEIARAIIGLAQGLGVDVLAEGVETDEQRLALERFGCRLMQGFLFYRPLPIADLEHVLERVTR